MFNKILSFTALINSSLQTLSILILRYLHCTWIIADLWLLWFNTLGPEQNGRYFVGDICNTFSSLKKGNISIEIPFKFAPNLTLIRVPSESYTKR